MNGDKDTTPLDLNDLPKEYGSKDNGKQTQFEAGSSSSGHGSRKKKKDVESGKLYECRFCSLSFYKSQALGGHMNRHRQERETETLNKARMLVFSNENNMPTVHGHPAHQLGGHMAGLKEGFYQHAITDHSSLQYFKPAFQVQSVSMRLPASSKSLIFLQQYHQINAPQPYLYPSAAISHFVPTYPNYLSKLSNDYCMGNNVRGTTIYTSCIGAPSKEVTSLNSSTINGVTSENGSLIVQASMPTSGVARHTRIREMME